MKRLETIYCERRKAEMTASLKLFVSAGKTEVRA